MTNEKTYPFKEGDDYWILTESTSEFVWSCWDDISEEMHDENPDRQYFTDGEVLDIGRVNGIKIQTNAELRSIQSL